MKRPYQSPLRWTLPPLMIVAMGCGGPEPESDGPELIIETSYGRVEGAAVDDGRGPAGDVLVFRGIPYAAPPVGELRWRPPEPALVVGDEVGAQAGVLKQKLDALDRALAGAASLAP